MNAVIIEDEKQAMMALQHELRTHCQHITVIGCAETISKAYELIISTKPDVVFLDIQLEDGSGFDLLAMFKTYNFKVIFTTAYSKYAIKAIKISALDYLLKPIDGKELSTAVNRIERDESENTLVKNLVLNNTLHPFEKKIALQTNSGIDLYKLKNIVYLNADSNYTCIYLISNKKILVSKTLKEFEGILAHLGFLRIHNSHIINLFHLLNYTNKNGGYVIMENKISLPVSKRKKSNLLEVLGIKG